MTCLTRATTFSEEHVYIFFKAFVNRAYHGQGSSIQLVYSPLAACLSTCRFTKFRKVGTWEILYFTGPFSLRIYLSFRNCIKVAYIFYNSVWSSEKCLYPPRFRKHIYSYTHTRERAHCTVLCVPYRVIKQQLSPESKELLGLQFSQKCKKYMLAFLYISIQSPPCQWYTGINFQQTCSQTMTIRGFFVPHTKITRC